MLVFLSIIFAVVFHFLLVTSKAPLFLCSCFRKLLLIDLSSDEDYGYGSVPGVGGGVTPTILGVAPSH